MTTPDTTSVYNKKLTQADSCVSFFISVEAYSSVAVSSVASLISRYSAQSGSFSV